jgi:hypothetical protein
MLTKDTRFDSDVNAQDEPSTIFGMIDGSDS